MHKFDKATEMPPEPVEEVVDEEAAAAVLEEVEIQKQAQGYRENLQMAKDLARGDPRVVANVVKAWVGSNE